MLQLDIFHEMVPWSLAPLKLRKDGRGFLKTCTEGHFYPNLMP